jgi:hypothetical protein
VTPSADQPKGLYHCDADPDCNRELRALSPSGDIVRSKKVRVKSESPFRNEIVKRWDAAVGTHEFERTKGGAGRFKQYQIFFDDVCSILIIASSLKIGVPSVADCFLGIR